MPVSRIDAYPLVGWVCSRFDEKKFGECRTNSQAFIATRLFQLYLDEKKYLPQEIVDRIGISYADTMQAWRQFYIGTPAFRKKTVSSISRDSIEASSRKMLRKFKAPFKKIPGDFAFTQQLLAYVFVEVFKAANLKEKKIVAKVLDGSALSSEPLEQAAELRDPIRKLRLLEEIERRPMEGWDTVRLKQKLTAWKAHLEQVRAFQYEVIKTVNVVLGAAIFALSLCFIQYNRAIVNGIQLISSLACLIFLALRISRDLAKSYYYKRTVRLMESISLSIREFVLEEQERFINAQVPEFVQKWERLVFEGLSEDPKPGRSCLLKLHRRETPDAAVRC